MLQMAADAAAPAARPSRTAETSTSTLWAPDAPLLQGRGLEGQLHLQQHQQGHILDAAVPRQHAQQELQQSQERTTKAAELPVSVALSAAVLDNASVSNNAERSHPTEIPSASQQEAQHKHHHHANQPWASGWAQPMLPAVSIAAGHSGQGRTSLGLHQRRRGTAESVAVSASLQQQRHSREVHAVRSLSWSQSAEDHPVGSLPSSGKWLIKAC